MVLVAESLSKKYDKEGVLVLNEVSMEIKEAESIALLGPSGTGKSTLLHIISGIEKATKGEVILCGESLDSISEDTLLELRKKNTGTVFQFFHLLPTLTAFENIEISLKLSGNQSQDGKERIDELLEYLGLSHRKDAFPSEMSGGELQRVAIARAVIHKPKIIFADEPTGNLDEDTGKIALDYLFKLCKKNETALFMVTHSREVANRCDRVYRLEHGRLRLLNK